MTGHMLYRLRRLLKRLRGLRLGRLKKRLRWLRLGRLEKRLSPAYTSASASGPSLVSSV